MTGKEAELLVRTERKWVLQASDWVLRFVAHRSCMPLRFIERDAEFFLVLIDKWALNEREDRITDGNIPEDVINACQPFAFGEEDYAANDWQVFQLVYDD